MAFLVCARLGFSNIVILVIDGNNRTLAAMIASGLPMRAKWPKRRSHRNGQSASHLVKARHLKV